MIGGGIVGRGCAGAAPLGAGAELAGAGRADFCAAWAAAGPEGAVWSAPAWARSRELGSAREQWRAA